MSGRAILGVIGAALVALLVWTSLRGGTATLPDFTLRNLSGEAVSARDLRGKVVVLNLWATWCPPCVEEMPSLEGLHRRMADRGLVVLAVNEDENVEVVAPWVREHGLTLPVVLDPYGEVAWALGVSGYPETFIADRQGRIVHHHVGYRDWNEPAVVTALEELLETGEWRLTAR